MGKQTNIAWTDHTYNPWIGCQQVTEAECGDCYAKRWAERHGLAVWGPLYGSSRNLTKTGADPLKWNEEARRTGIRSRVFCASLADVFEPHPQVEEARHRLWDLIEQTPHLDWQLLTKRPRFITRLVPATWLDHWPAYVWIGTSVGIQAAAAKRIPPLLEVPAPVVFLSCEPLVEPLHLAPWLLQGTINWVICGGYSGAQHRPMDPDWARSLRDECARYEVAFFMKQMGSVYAKAHHLRDSKGEDIAEFPDDLKIREFPLSRLSQEEKKR